MADDADTEPINGGIEDEAQALLPAPNDGDEE